MTVQMKHAGACRQAPSAGGHRTSPRLHASGCVLLGPKGNDQTRGSPFQVQAGHMQPGGVRSRLAHTYRPSTPRTSHVCPVKPNLIPKL